MSIPRLRVQQLRINDGSDAIAFDLMPSETVCLSGASGTGKSRLLRALADLDPHDGEILLDGVCQRQLSPPAWRRKVALLPAEPGWWSENVAEHFVASLPTNEALQKLGLEPQVLHRAVSLLSTGERQRLAILRLLQQQPQVLLLDEPTAHLDTASREQVEAVIQDYQQQSGAAVLWVSHSAAQQQRLATRVLTLSAQGGLTA